MRSLILALALATAGHGAADRNAAAQQLTARTVAPSARSASAASRDLEGVWNYATLTPEARARQAARNADARDHPADGPENRSLQERCLAFNAGPPIGLGPYNNFLQIFQTRDAVVIYTEMIHDARIVWTDGRPHLPPTQRRWLGDSRGRWEGNTLIVDTINFTDKNPFRGSGENLHLTERFTRTDANTLLYEFTVDDPTTFTRAWTAQLPMSKSDERIFEYACHEGNYALPDILRGARFQERQSKEPE